MLPLGQNRRRHVGHNLDNFIFISFRSSRRVDSGFRLTSFPSRKLNNDEGGAGTSSLVGPTYFMKGRHLKPPIIPTKIDENITKVIKDKVILNE